MKETVAEFTKRTGLKYTPPKFVTKQATALERDEALPTLFRFPGPCGLLEEFLQGAKLLGPQKGGELWAADAPLNSEARGAEHFGTIALLQPLRFHFARQQPGIYVGVNLPIPREELAWIPPSRIRAAIPWDSIKTASEAAKALGNTERERHEVLADLAEYRKELVAVAKAKIDRPDVRWCDRPAEERARLLKAKRLASPWT